MKPQELNMDTVFNAIDNVKPQKGSAYVEKHLSIHAAKFAQYIENGYSEEQIYNAFPAVLLDEIGLDKKTFIRKLRFIITKHLKALASSPAPVLPTITVPVKNNELDDELVDKDNLI